MEVNYMKICIYCKNNLEKSKSKEHVIMQSFGKFGSQTPTLDCVCNECNDFFKKELDQVFARNSLEGTTRYRKGIYSRESRYQDKNYLMITLPKTQEFGEWGGVIVWVDGRTGQVMPPLPQVHFKNSNGEYIPILEFELENLDWRSKGYIDKDIKIFASSKEKHDELIDKLKKIGINYKLKSTSKPNFIENYKDKKMPVNIQGTIDHTIKRALAKILFNFSAKYIGYDEVMKPEWNKARDYIRFNQEPIKVRVLNEPFWGEESTNVRYFDNAYNIRVENSENNLVGVIQFFNLFLYEFILVENYNIPATKQVAARFAPGQEPVFGKKMKAVKVGGYKIPLVGK